MALPPYANFPPPPLLRLPRVKHRWFITTYDSFQVKAERHIGWGGVDGRVKANASDSVVIEVILAHENQVDHKQEITKALIEDA